MGFDQQVIKRSWFDPRIMTKIFLNFLHSLVMCGDNITPNRENGPMTSWVKL